ncbi:MULTISPECIES: hypothetical protein [Neobacillus]|uniref:Uncharacterized protein n=1 Tax=Neobacillus rhizophilus TaxID=2833579 RepID=A0A942U7K2_9BACI|nr:MULTISPECIES: hypothetical protein [Neobacillus]MBS4212929.1 hypothetical protein [Neobacillus rhizophilus]
MFKRLIILVILLSVLLAMVLLKNNTPSPVNNTTTESSDSSGFTTIEYEITDIKGEQYYGKGTDGTKIEFSADKIIEGERVQVHDTVICYFDKHNFGKGLVKVEKK